MKLEKEGKTPRTEESSKEAWLKAASESTSRITTMAERRDGFFVTLPLSLTDFRLLDLRPVQIFPLSPFSPRLLTEIRFLSCSQIFSNELLRRSISTHVEHQKT